MIYKIVKLIILAGILWLCFVCAKAQETQPPESPKTTTFEDLLKVKPEKTSDGNSQFTLGDECGSQSYESQLYVDRKGKVTKILGANRVVFEQAIEEGYEENRKFTVELVGIDPVTNRKNIIQFLEKYVLNQDVEVTGNLRKESDKKFKGLVFVTSDDDEVNWINENLLENGIAKYQSFESANLVSMVMPCRLQKAEERAKAAKLGIWAN